MSAHPLVCDDFPLGPLTTYKLGGSARRYAEVGDVSELRSVVAAHAGSMPVLVLGRGSNVLVSDGGFDGLVVHLVGALALADVEDGVIVAGGGMPLPRLARFAATQSLGGVEFFVGIPGSVGGAVRMNAGGHGSDTASVLVDAAVFHCGDGTVDTVPVSALELGYRRSNLTGDDIVFSARFATTPRPRSEIEGRPSATPTPAAMATGSEWEAPVTATWRTERSGERSSHQETRTTARTRSSTMRRRSRRRARSVFTRCLRSAILGSTAVTTPAPAAHVRHRRTRRRTGPRAPARSRSPRRPAAARPR
ncbi:MAG: FAD-binding protein [Actinobacteria bacterium]|nr:MAG: FAD-binding protein [Actinomycetota bacterium]